MSRIGKLPVKIDAGVTITVDDSNVVTVKGPKGTLSQQMHPDMQIEQDNGVLTVKRPSDDKAHRALHGLTRSLIHNMVVGVTTWVSPIPLSSSPPRASPSRCPLPTRSP